jgi:hypothetical protein
MSDYVVVSTVSGQFAEEQVRAFLEAQGIPTEVRGETLRSTHGLSLDSLGAVEILVPREQEEEARALLAAAESGELRLAEEETEAMEGTDRQEKRRNGDPF